MKLHPNEMWLFFDCESSTHKKTRALAYSITEHVNEFTFREKPISKMMWSEILEMLGLRPKDLLNKANPKYQAEIAGHNFDENGWLDILMNNPCMIKGPIAVMHNRAVLCEKPKDIYKLTDLHRDKQLHY